MLYCGCTYEPVRQSYLTESHQRHSTLLYRTWFCDLNYFLSLRMYRWCCFSKRSLAKLKARFKDDWPDDIPGHKIPIEDVGKFPPGIIILIYNLHAHITLSLYSFCTQPALYMHTCTQHTCTQPALLLVGRWYY